MNYVRDFVVSLLFAILGESAVAGPAQQILLAKINAAAPAYDFIEYFEGSQVDNNGTSGYNNAGWFSLGTSNPTYATSPAPLQGAHSLISAYGTYNCDINSFVDSTSAYLFFQCNLATANLNGAYTLVMIAGTSDEILLRTTTSHEFTLQVGPAATVYYSPTSAFSDGTTFYAWLEYTAGSGANAIGKLYISSTRTKPGSPVISVTDGTATQHGANFRFFQNGSSGNPAIYDWVIANHTPIGDVP